MKRIFDLTGAVLGLALVAPLLLLLMIAVRCDSAGPALFSQLRIGRERRPFLCHKIRTMSAGVPDLPTHLVDMSQITRVGRVLRRTKLDELPQLWNVLTGEMSLVGPRPCLPSQHQVIEERERRGIFAIRPGITGLAQISGIDMSDPVRVAEKDAEYLCRQSLALDMMLLLRTVAGRGARIDG